MSNFTQYDVLEIDSITLTTRDEVQYNITNLLHELNIYSSMFEATLEANITLVDAMNIVSNYPIVGGEKIKARWKTSGVKDYQEVNLRVGSIGERVMEENTSVLRLHLCSEVRYADSLKRLSRGFEGTYSDILKQTFAEFGSNLIDHGETVGLTTFASPNWNPLKIIEWCVGRGYDSNQSPLMFWEDIDGFRYKSVNDMLSQNPTRKMFQNPAGMEDNVDQLLNTVKQMEYLPGREAISQRYDGMNCYEESVYNAKDKSFIHRERGYDEYFKKGNHLDKHPIVNDELTRTSGDLTKFRLHREDKSHISAHQRQMLSHALSNVRLRLSSSGNSESRVGDVIAFDVLSPQPQPDGSPAYERYISGNFLVVSTRHIIRPNVYILAQEIAKESYNDKLGANLNG